MPLPAIPPYDMPAALAASAVHWSPQRDRAALLVHDMQHYFLRPFADGRLLAALLANVHALRQACAEHGVPVIYSQQRGSQSVGARGLTADFWGPGMSDSPADTAIPETIAPHPGDHEVIKRRYSAFHATTLRQLLTDLDRDQLIICGVYAHIGIQQTAADAMQHDLPAFVVADAVADFDRDRHETALRYIGDLFGRVLRTRNVITAFGQQRQARSGAAG
ncbi:isochorismatase family protein [Nonomuraea fuscirosea]